MRYAYATPMEKMHKFNNHCCFGDIQEQIKTVYEIYI